MSKKFIEGLFQFKLRCIFSRSSGIVTSILFFRAFISLIINLIIIFMFVMQVSHRIRISYGACVLLMVTS